MKKRLPFTKDLIISIHIRFHAMVIMGQTKTKKPNENRGVQKGIKSCILKVIYFQKPFPKLVTIGWLKQI
jgi:hypothetical protein